MLLTRGGRYSLLDFARFLAAICVVIYHYQHFMEKPYLQTLSWYPYIDLFIEKGYLAVPFFWTLSGFVIASTYTPATWRGARRFFLFRFARLYPLHLVTLILVTMLQIVSLQLNGYGLIYTNQNISNFLFHLFFLSGFSESLNGNYFSFNAPVWSVSLEIMCYGLFALLMVLKKLKSYIIYLLFMAVIFIDAYSELPDQLVRVNLYFFTGVIIYFLKVEQNQVYRYFFFIFYFSCLLLSIGQTPTFLMNVFPSLQIFQYRYIALFALVISILLWLEPRVSSSISKKFIQLGNLSYAIYLLHIPTQLILLITVPLFFENSKFIAGEIMFFIAFLFIVLIFSNLIFKHFEEPCRQRIRRVLDE